MVNRHQTDLKRSARPSLPGDDAATRSRGDPERMHVNTAECKRVRGPSTRPCSGPCLGPGTWRTCTWAGPPGDPSISDKESHMRLSFLPEQRGFPWPFPQDPTQLPQATAPALWASVSKRDRDRQARPHLPSGQCEAGLEGASSRDEARSCL